jgi:hypothetical protein
MSPSRSGGTSLGAGYVVKPHRLHVQCIASWAVSVTPPSVCPTTRHLVFTCLILPGQAGTVTVALPASGTAIETDVRSHDENSATAGPLPEVADHRVMPGPQDDQAGVGIRERAAEVLAEMPLQQVARSVLDPLPDDRATGGQEGANHRSADLAKSLAGARCHEPTHSGDGGHVVRL